MQQVPVLGLILGDHAGSSPEIVAKTILAKKDDYIPVLIGNWKLFERSRKVVEGANKIEIKPLEGRPKVGGKYIAYFANVEISGDIQYSTVSSESGKLIYKSVKKSIELEKAGIVDGLAMAPITKASLHAAGYDFSTEFEMFADLYNTQGVKAVIKCGDIFRSTVVGHCPFVDISKKLNEKGIEDTAEGLVKVMSMFMPRQNCKIAIAALNPHAGENGLYGLDEIKYISPTVKRLREKGISVIGPIPADTVFLKALNKEVGGVVFLYHDQGNIAMKSVCFGDGVLIYTNIPAHIVSVGHGPAMGKAGKGTADPKNMIASVEVLLQIIQHKTLNKRVI